MKPLEKIYEGKAKILYTTADKDYLIQYFKDDATAFDATKRGTIRDKGVVNNKVSEALFTYLEKKGIPTHFVKRLSDREMLVRRVKIVPLEVTMRNVAAGGLSRSLGVAEGLVLRRPVFEFHYKSDELHDPLINDDHVLSLKIATEETVKKIKAYSFKINRALKTFFGKRGIILVDFKLEFGTFKKKILLADEISPDTMRLWDKRTKEKLDKDRFRYDLGNVENAYARILKTVSAS